MTGPVIVVLELIYKIDPTSKHSISNEMKTYTFYQTPSILWDISNERVAGWAKFKPQIPVSISFSTFTEQEKKQML